MDVQIGDVPRIKTGNNPGTAWEVVKVLDRNIHNYLWRKLGDVSTYPADYRDRMEEVWEKDVFLTEVNRMKPK